MSATMAATVSVVVSMIVTTLTVMVVLRGIVMITRVIVRVHRSRWRGFDGCFHRNGFISRGHSRWGRRSRVLEQERDAGRRAFNGLVSHRMADRYQSRRHGCDV